MTFTETTAYVSFPNNGGTIDTKNVIKERPHIRFNTSLMCFCLFPIFSARSSEWLQIWLRQFIQYIRDETKRQPFCRCRFYNPFPEKKLLYFG